MHAGDAGFAPVSSAHYFKNVGDTDCYVVLIFNSGRFTNIDATALVGNMPAEVRRCTAALCILPPRPEALIRLAGTCSLASHLEDRLHRWCCLVPRRPEA